MLIQDTQITFDDFDKSEFSRTTSKSLYDRQNGHAFTDKGMYPNDSFASGDLTDRRSNTSSRSRSRSKQNSFLGLTSKSFTNSDSALPLSHGNNSRVSRVPSLPQSNASDCSTSQSDAKIMKEPPSVPERTSSSPQKKKTEHQFFGRNWVFDRIHGWLQMSSFETNTTCSLILMGGPGTEYVHFIHHAVSANFMYTNCLVTRSNSIKQSSLRSKKCPSS